MVKAFMSYLISIFEKLNMFNTQLQGSNKGVTDAAVLVIGELQSC